MEENERRRKKEKKKNEKRKTTMSERRIRVKLKRIMYGEDYEWREIRDKDRKKK